MLLFCGCHFIAVLVTSWQILRRLVFRLPALGDTSCDKAGVLRELFLLRLYMSNSIFDKRAWLKIIGAQDEC